MAKAEPLEVAQISIINAPLVNLHICLGSKHSTFDIKWPWPSCPYLLNPKLQIDPKELSIKA
jgi:hypothetical protein